MPRKIKLPRKQLIELKIAAENHPLELRALPFVSSIGLAMRCACPVPGGDWAKFMTVLLKPGEQVKSHQHKRHAILFYPEDCDPVVINGKVIHPKAGEVHYLKPGVVHHVPPVTRTRLSVAMLVDDQ
jgi:hypothetical protein